MRSAAGFQVWMIPFRSTEMMASWDDWTMAARRSWAPTSSENSLADGVLNELGRRPDLKLRHHLVLVEGDGPRRDVQNSRDFLHRVTLREQPQHLALTGREVDGGRLLLLHERLNGRLRQRGRKIASALHDVTHRTRQLGGGRARQDVGRGADAKRFRCEVGVLVHRQEDQFDLRKLLLQLTRQLEAVRGRHRNVEDDDIRTQLVHGTRYRRAVVDLADDIPLVSEQLLERVEKQRVIVSEQNSRQTHGVRIRATKSLHLLAFP